MPLTPEDVANKRFRVTRMKAGYDEEEVDAFLDEVEAELRRLTGENDQLRVQLAAVAEGPGSSLIAAPPSPPAVVSAPVAPAPAPPAPPAEGQEAALRTLLLAQRTADQAIAEARAEASELVRKAQDEAAAIQREAGERRNREMAGLVRERQDLETLIEAMRGFEREYRTRLRAYLQSQLRELEGRQVEPAGGPPTRGAGSGQPPAGQSPAGLTSTSRAALSPGGYGGPPRQVAEAADTADIDERRERPEHR